MSDGLPHILFVDDQVNVLRGIQRMLRRERSRWKMDFAESGKDALALLAETRFDVIVSDMQMPGMSGAELLTEVKRLHPDTIRIILSGHSDQELVLASLESTHRFLAKPCETETLKATIESALALQALHVNERLRELVSGMKSLPSLPSLYTQVVEALNAPDSSLQKVGEIISQDVGMSAKILHLVNSAFFGLPRRVSSPAHAATLLGVDLIRSLVLSVGVFSQFSRSDCAGLDPDLLWNHCHMTGHFARQIARAAKWPKSDADDAFMAGLLHDVGKLVLAVNLGDEYGAVIQGAQQAGVRLEVKEREAVGTTHEEVGAYLFGLWGLPAPIIKAVACHHTPGSNTPAEECFPLAAVHVANHIDHERRGGGDSAPPLDTGYLERCGVAGRIEEWRRCCEETLDKEKEKA